MVVVLDCGVVNFKKNCKSLLAVVEGTQARHSVFNVKETDGGWCCPLMALPGGQCNDVMAGPAAVLEHYFEHTKTGAKLGGT